MTTTVLERAWLDLTDALSPLDSQEQIAYLSRLALLAAERIADPDSFTALCAQARPGSGSDADEVQG